MTYVLAEVVAEISKYRAYKKCMPGYSICSIPLFVIILKVVKARLRVGIFQPPICKHLLWVIQDELLGIDILEEPRERLTLMILLELESVFKTSCKS